MKVIKWLLFLCTLLVTTTTLAAFIHLKVVDKPKQNKPKPQEESALMPGITILSGEATDELYVATESDARKIKDARVKKVVDAQAKQSQQIIQLAVQLRSSEVEVPQFKSAIQIKTADLIKTEAKFEQQMQLPTGGFEKELADRQTKDQINQAEQIIYLTNLIKSNQIKSPEFRSAIRIKMVDAIRQEGKFEQRLQVPIRAKQIEQSETQMKEQIKQTELIITFVNQAKNNQVKPVEFKHVDVIEVIKAEGRFDKQMQEAFKTIASVGSQKARDQVSG